VTQHLLALLRHLYISALKVIPVRYLGKHFMMIYRLVCTAQDKARCGQC